jgi:uncharacterized membrane protein
MMPTTHPLATAYLRRLDAATTVLSGPDREELLAQIRDHIDAGLAPDATEADVRNLLDELGSPEQIVAAARQENALADEGARPLERRRRVPVFEIVALVVLALGYLATPLIGWLPGAAMVLMSRMWSWRTKLTALVLLLALSAVSLIWGRSMYLGPSEGLSLLVASLVVGYLGWRLRRGTGV